jgi:hypothetical protein
VAGGSQLKKVFTFGVKGALFLRMGHKNEEEIKYSLTCSLP